MTDNVVPLTAGTGASTEDRLLGGRVVLRQPVDGLRAAIDPVFLAAAVSASPGDTVLEAGIGSGAAALCLARRVPGVSVVGIDMQRDLVRLAVENAALNGLEGSVTAMVGDIANPPPRLAPGSYDHVIANPPFMEAGSGTVSPHPVRAAAAMQSTADLKQWIRFALAMVKSRGTLTFVHRADRLDSLLAELSGRAGEITIFPLWPGEGKAARRIVVRARRGVATPTRMLPGLVLHLPDGRYTAGAEAILRGGAALDLDA